jgi:hypothetical protein
LKNPPVPLQKNNDKLNRSAITRLRDESSKEGSKSTTPNRVALPQINNLKKESSVIRKRNQSDDISNIRRRKFGGKDRLEQQPKTVPVSKLVSDNDQILEEGHVIDVLAPTNPSSNDRDITSTRKS